MSQLKNCYIFHLARTPSIIQYYHNIGEVKILKTNPSFLYSIQFNNDLNELHGQPCIVTQKLKIRLDNRAWIITNTTKDVHYRLMIEH